MRGLLISWAIPGGQAPDARLLLGLQELPLLIGKELLAPLADRGQHICEGLLEDADLAAGKRADLRGKVSVGDPAGRSMSW